jgi:hypothetical protein
MADFCDIFANWQGSLKFKGAMGLGDVSGFFGLSILSVSGGFKAGPEQQAQEAARA